jgi:hypothetical protein
MLINPLIRRLLDRKQYTTKCIFTLQNIYYAEYYLLFTSQICEQYRHRGGLVSALFWLLLLLLLSVAVALSLFPISFSVAAIAIEEPTPKTALSSVTWNAG